MTKEKDTRGIAKRIFSILIVLMIVAGVCYAGMSDVFHVHERLEISKSLVTLQAEYEKDFSSEGTTFENPKIIVDPYKASPLTALIIFETPNTVAPTVKIPGLTGDFEFKFAEGRKHYLPIYALMPDTTNQVEISFFDNNGITRKTFEIKTGSLPVGMQARADVNKYYDVGNELYFATPSSVGQTVAYDNAGNVRWYLSNYALWDISRLANGHLLVSTERLINTPYYMTGLYEIDLLGKIYNEWSLPGGYHHDYAELPSGNLLVASDNFDEANETVEDYVVELDRKTGEIVKTWDLQKILPTANTGNENWSGDDWFHNNSVWFDENTQSITLSGRHADAVVNLDYESGKINWILGDSTGWPEDYQKYFFTAIGNTEWQWSQHAAMITPNGDVFVLDNGNNKSKLSDQYVPASESYTRGVMYAIDTDAMTARQVWQYGKERGAEFYSPYISDVNWLAEGHYIVHSGGISTKNGEPSNQPAFYNGSDKLWSDMVEIIEDQVAFEMKLTGNYYRVEKMSPYTSADKKGLKLGAAKRHGSLGRTVVSETQSGLPSGSIKIDDNYEKHEIKFVNEEDRLSFTGTFKKSSNVRVMLSQGFTKKYYKMRVTNAAHAALCVSVFSEEENADAEDIKITRYINSEDLKGTYKIFVEIYDKLYDTGQSVMF